MRLKDTQEEIRLRAEADCEFFIRLVAPRRLLGAIHIDVLRWWDRPGYKSHQILFLPRDHQKSALAGYRTAWKIIKNPAIRVLYISSTSNLATKQLKFIKDILTSNKVRQYWPELINLEEAKREKWTETEISVDHPLRKLEAIRDPTIFTAGLTTNVVGLHCDLAVLDDPVTDDTAYTEEGRARVKRQYSFLASIEGADAEQMVVGTRYHPKDLYNDLIEMKVPIFNETGDMIDEQPVYEIFGDETQRMVEDQGDGSGTFLWPKQQRADGRWFGFDRNILERKKAQYLDKTQFRAQYYNDPNDITGAGITNDLFQYFERNHVQRSGGIWSIKGRRLNVFCAIDFAYSLRPEADFSSIVVVGIDGDRNFYILDIDRFKTKSLDEYYKHILTLHQKWDFRKIRAEVNVAQEVIVDSLKMNYIRRDGLSLVVEPVRPTARDGNKAERIYNVLQPLYANRQLWHFRGGYCQTLEEELILQNPPHDDIKDALASVIPMCIAPTMGRTYQMVENIVSHPRFGGI